MILSYTIDFTRVAATDDVTN